MTSSASSTSPPDTEKATKMTISSSVSPSSQVVTSRTPESSGPPSITIQHPSPTHVSSHSPSFTTRKFQQGTLQSTTLRTASTAEILPPKCLNGGVPIGDRCDCPSPYVEPFCREARNEVVVGTIVATINVFIKVINVTFHKEMAVRGSLAFQTFATRFEQQMRFFYANVTGFQRVVVIRLSEGSVNVDHQVVLQMPFSKFNASYDEAVAKVQTELDSRDCSPEGKDMICFNRSDTKVAKVPVSAEDLSETCRNDSLVKRELQPFYVARNISNQLECVSNCSFSHPDPFRCDHGNCYIQADGPNCYCQQSDAYWYTGRHCDQSISKVGVAVGVSLGLAVLLLLLLLLAALLCWQRSRPRKGHRRLYSNPSEEKGYRKDSDWVAGPQDLSPRSPPAQEQRPAPSAGTSREDACPTPAQSSFRPRLDQVDTSLQAQIARPQITRL